VSERIQKILARSGYGSRRACELMIRAGRVRVNGAVAQLGSSANPVIDRIEVDGEPLVAPPAHVYLALNKPAGYTTTMRDPHAARAVVALLPRDLPAGIVPVGRLDRDTEGLLIFTNDGEFAHRLAHPRYEVEKEYYALVEGVPPAAALEQLRRGIVLDGRRTGQAAVDASGPPHGYAARMGATWLRIVLHEGRKRQIRRMCEAVRHPVIELVRTRIGPVSLGSLDRGALRPLNNGELAALRRRLALDRR
jgi:23S rRNA pseudouridine2605 synthase